VVTARSRGTRVLLGVAAVAGAIALAGCGEGAQDATGDVTAERGGVYRVAQTDFGFNGGFDPTGEYLGFAWTIQTNLLVRPLVGYRHTAGPGGNELLPDLAVEVPEPTEGGRVYTFRLKPGVRFAPPVDREVTSRDVAYAFERLATPALVPQYAFYYSDIEGFQAFADGKARAISGIRTPDDRTIEFRLTRPVGDFPYRLAMPATAPIPREVARCATAPGAYGRFLIATGPYMIAGSEDLALGDCARMTPISGFRPTRRLSLVRNPNYDPATDSPEQRSALPDRFEFVVNTNLKDIFDGIAAGRYEDSPDTAPAEVARRYARDADLRDRLTSAPEDSTAYISMNLAEPPFDDVHVRRAVNWAIDKSALQRAWGGRTYGDIATHVVPPTMYGGEETIEGYDPYATADHAGDVARARDEMRRSRYDSDGDGLCDAGPCRGVVFVNRNLAPYPRLSPVVRDNLARIGIRVEVRELPTGPSYDAVGNVRQRVPIAINSRWAKDYADPITFFNLFRGDGIIPAGNVNHSLVGLTAAQARELGVAYPAGGVPGIDADIERCAAEAGDARTRCWVALDRRVMEDIVPWVPYLSSRSVGVVGPAVTRWDFDQFGAETAYAHVAVDPARQSR